uniref:cinnamyl-alcohol dehydrogenase n=1 Tax=Leersia perrieri TaxID=77586 RepID=A0A0D9XIE0_9ORYZ
MPISVGEEGHVGSSACRNSDLETSCSAVSRSDMAAECGSGNCDAWAARDPFGILSPYKFDRKHEIAGVVAKVGADVRNFKVGDHVGVGTYVNSCRDCEKLSRELLLKTHLHFQWYCFKIPDGYPLEKAAPLLCAGITVYTPMMRHNMNQPGKSLGVIGLGGLGHMAVKFGKAFGLKVTVISTSESKREEAVRLLGADNFVISSDENQIESLKSSLHFIIDTASGDHPFDPYLSLLKVGVMALHSFPSEIKVHPANLNLGGRSLSGSVTGATKDIQEMINLCAANKIYPDIEMLKMDYIHEALQRLVDRDVRFRFVIDIENSF